MELVYRDRSAGVMFYSNKTKNYIYKNEHGVEIKKIAFQDGFYKEFGVNGVTNESMIAILIHRIRSLDDKCPSIENKKCLEFLGQALVILEHRTSDRVHRGVEGTSTI